MKIIITKDYDEMSKVAFGFVKRVVTEKPDAVLGLPTGTTPLGLYREMIADHKANGTSYKQVKVFNLDEYAGISADNDQSYVYFMRHNLFDHIDIPRENTNIENGAAADREAECARYDALLEENPRDLQVLGIGSNGHIAFNEPGTPFGSTTHVVDLTESTIKDNSRLFEKAEDVPRKALSMGLKSIMQAKEIIIIIDGAHKADAVYKLVKGEVTEDMPASVLQLHNNCTLICDEAAAKLIK